MAERITRMDVIHPQASLNFEHCHAWWKQFQPVQCVFLHDKVVVLDKASTTGDRVHISSADSLIYWDFVVLSYFKMSLSTYKNQLVAVGGRCNYTSKVSNVLLSSSTGYDWQATLPPMPTKRYSTSSVSVESSTILVVAGGYNSDDKATDVVEVLMDRQWSTVDPLPTACRVMRSTVNGGNVYFTGGYGQYDTIYTCTCKSLKTPRDRMSTSIWTKIQAPNKTVTIASFSSRLVSIDVYGAIRGYYNKDWIETIREGELKLKSTDCIAAAESTNGDIVLAHESEGIYRVTVSESKNDSCTSSKSEGTGNTQVKCFSLAVYPPLAKSHSEKGIMKVPAGFSADCEVSATYTGKSASLDWEERGITLFFENSSDHSSEVERQVHVSAIGQKVHRYSKKTELASGLFYINNVPDQVTARIKHSMPKDNPSPPCIMMCSDDTDPKNFTTLIAEKFTQTYTEISVPSYFSYVVGISIAYGVKGILSLMEKSYQMLLYHSTEPRPENSGYSWTIYVSILKNCSCFKASMRNYIMEEYKDNVTLSFSEIVYFTDTEDSITATASCEDSLTHLNSYGSPTIKKTYISRYVDGRPPHIKYDLQVPQLSREVSTVWIQITLEGLKKPNNHLYLKLNVPQSPSSQLATMPQRNLSFSSLEQDSSRHGFKIRLKDLQKGPNGLNLIRSISTVWKRAGDLLGLHYVDIDIIEKNNPRDIVNCCREVMNQWLCLNMGESDYEPNWEGFCKLLNDLGYSSLVQQIQTTILK